MRKFLVLLAAIVAPLGIAGYAVADSGGRSDAAKAQSATARYHDLQDALDDGYSILPATTAGAVVGTNGCASSAQGLGAMGVHYLKAELLDGSVDAQSPEVLVYEPRANGRSKLVALEYVATSDVPAPSLFGQVFSLTDLEPYGAPPGANAWTLHAWIWAPNPSGLLFAWNPRVTCENA